MAEADSLEMADLASVIPAALDSAQPPVRNAVDHLRPAIGDALRDRIPVIIPQYQPMTGAAAVLEYAAHVAAAWAVAIALEGLVFALLCVLLVRANLDRMGSPNDRIELPDDRTGHSGSLGVDVRQFRSLDRVP